MIDVIEQQNEIIRLQTEVIDELFSQLLQYVSINEEEKLLENMQRLSEMQKPLN